MRASALILAVLVVAACKPRSDTNAVAQSGETRAASDAATARTAIERINANVVRWYATGQADSIADAYAPDAWLMPPSSAPIVSRDSIRAFAKGGLAGGAWRFTLTSQDVAASGDIAVERGKYALEFVRAPNAPTGAMPSFKDHGNYVVHWVRSGDKWLIKWDAAVSDMPMAPPK
jgi:ketosteroid isomerase-like protein